MGNHIASQLLLFGQSVLLGAALGVVYDLLRPLRHRRPRAAGICDGAYCLCALAAVFRFVLRRAAGELRLYMLVGIAGGAALFFCLFSLSLRPVWDFWADTLAFLLRMLARPACLGAAFCKKNGPPLQKCLLFCAKMLYNRKNRSLARQKRAQRRRRQWQRRQKPQRQPTKRREPAFSPSS
jgi:hypothetical protein